MKTTITAIAASLALTFAGQAQDPTSETSLTTINERLQKDLERVLAEYDAVLDEIAEQRLPLGSTLTRVEAERGAADRELREKQSLRDRGELEVNNLKTKVKEREAQATYIDTLLTDYVDEVAKHLHVAEKRRYASAVDQAKGAINDKTLTPLETFDAQMAFVDQSIDRLEAVLGGELFEGPALDPSGLVSDGKFALVGPTALFRSVDGRDVGTAEGEEGDTEAAVLVFRNELDRANAAEVVTTGSGAFPLDPTLGNAHRLASINDETILDEFQKGGPVMYPIIGMAAAALLVALWKWFRLSTLPRPSRRRIKELLESVANRNHDEALDRARAMKGPMGSMLRQGAEHLGDPRELVEEVMYEKVLTSKLKLNSLLPFIAICAASAPLLGLLGTVTGIISTFHQITLEGSGNAKTLSGGISEALITTKFGLIVAIPSLLLHAYLSRKARAAIGLMETTAISFVNQVDKVGGFGRRPEPAPSRVAVSEAAPNPDAVRGQVQEILSEMLGPLTNGSAESHAHKSSNVG